MISLLRLPTLCGIIIVGLSLIYLSLFGPPVVHSKLHSATLWYKVAQSLQSTSLEAEASYHATARYQVSSQPTTTTLTVTLTTHTHHQGGSATMSKHPPSDHSSLSGDSAHSACSKQKPNLVLSAISGAILQDQIFFFMQSLDIAIGQEMLASHRAKSCPPAPVHVHVLVPLNFMEQIPSSFKALMDRYPSLEFVPALPNVGGVHVVLTRFKGWAAYLKPISDQYDRVLAIDMDVAFQRNPFAMPMDPGVELLYFAEWRGLKIGQCRVHQRWFDGCASCGTINHNISSGYMHLDRICAGSTYGTAKAMQVYLDMMADKIGAANWGCNDQAMHIHIYYSGLLDKELASAGLGKTCLMPNEEALLGTVGTTPMVRFNEWGEILNDNGRVQHVIHQFKTHARLSQIIWMRYGWIAPVGDRDAIPPAPRLVQEGGQSDRLGATGGKDPPAENPKELKRYILSNVSHGSCNGEGHLCSCRFDSCQLQYEFF